jgi:hypothetical protein
MRIARVGQSIIGRTLALPVYAADGRILLNSGTVLTQSYVEGLERWGYSRIAIEDEIIRGIRHSDPVSVLTRVKATGAVRMALLEAERSHTFDITGPHSAVESILQDIQSNRNVVHSLCAVRSFDDYTYVHSVNVCILCILIGQVLGYNRYDLKKLATGALLHDLGKIHVPSSILNKPGQLTNEEFEIVRTHSYAGFEMLSQKTSAVSAHVALQHHERTDGSGYPRGLKNGEIHEYGRIAAIADVYDALTTDRPYREALPPGDALSLLSRPSTGMDQSLLHILMSRIALYSEGAVLLFEDGRVAVVTEQTHDPMRPRVRVLSTHDGVFVEPHDIDLAVHSEIAIHKVLDDYPKELAQSIEKHLLCENN